MKKYDPFAGLAPMTKALHSPAFTQEKTYLDVIGKSLRMIEEIKARQEWAKHLPHSPAMQSYAITPTALMDVAVLKTLGKGGSLVDEES